MVILLTRDMTLVSPWLVTVLLLVIGKISWPQEGALLQNRKYALLQCHYSYQSTKLDGLDKFSNCNHEQCPFTAAGICRFQIVVIF